MPRPKSDRILEEDNRRDIGSLREAISQLNTSVAVLIEATKSLKDVLDREVSRHSDDIKALSSRESVTEVRVDNVEIALAKSSAISDRLLNMEDRLSNIEASTDLIKSRLDIRDGWSKGAMWVVGITLGICVPSTAWLAASTLGKVFGMGGH